MSVGEPADRNFLRDDSFPAATPPSLEGFPALCELGVAQGFVRRARGIDVNVDRADALARLVAIHQNARKTLGLAERTFFTAEQVHGNQITALTSGNVEVLAPCAASDGMITDRPDVCLGIYVADCCAIYLVDTRRRAIGLVHSGRRGTELGIVPNAIHAMHASFGSRVEDLVVQLSPCIRPPWYEVDFAAEIVRQCLDVGAVRVFDPGICTAAHPDLYYSYRREKGRTGRMLALLALR